MPIAELWEERGEEVQSPKRFSDDHRRNETASGMRARPYPSVGPSASQLVQARRSGGDARDQIGATGKWRRPARRPPRFLIIDPITRWRRRAGLASFHEFAVAIVDEHERVRRDAPDRARPPFALGDGEGPARRVAARTLNEDRRSRICLSAASPRPDRPLPSPSSAISLYTTHCKDVSDRGASRARCATYRRGAR